MRLRGVAIGVALLLQAGCATSPPTAMTPTPHPLVIAHRGASGYLPEETLEAYRLAIEQGADVLELDAISTKDGVLIARHDPQLSISTDVAQHPEFANRKMTRSLDGDSAVSDWWACDFTLAEIRTLGATSTDPQRPQQYNGQFRIVTVQAVFDLAQAEGRARGRVVGVYPETKNASFHRDLGLPLEDKLIALITAAGWNDHAAPVWVQSFEPSSLREMRAKGLKTKLVQLVDGAGYDYATGTVAAPDGAVNARPFDWVRAGDARTFRDLLTPAGLAEVATYADGIGPWKAYIVGVKQREGGSATLADSLTQPPTTLIDDAHRAGLYVHAFTFRNEARRLARDYGGDPKAELRQFYALGLDGVFTDFPDTALAVRAELTSAPGR